MRDRDHSIEEDETFQAHTWTVQRVAWALFTLVPLAALTGLFAHGYLSNASKGDTGTLLVNYERFQRVTRTVRFTFHIGPEQPSGLRLDQIKFAVLEASGKISIIKAEEPC